MTTLILATSARPVFAFAARVVNAPDWGETIYNTTTAGRAKREHQLSVSDAWPDIEFTAIRVRKLGAPHTSAEFRRNARYRGLPQVRCGQRVELPLVCGGSAFGTIVGHNASANFEVLFDDDSALAGRTCNVHPEELRIL
jgi:hypothetical protein